MGERSSRPLFLRGWAVATAGVFFAGLFVVALLFVPWALLQNWTNGITVDDTVLRTLLASATQAILLTAGGALALVGVGISLTRRGHEIEELADARTREAARATEAAASHALAVDHERREQFQKAVGLLASESTISRIAGLHALAALGDGWNAEQNRGELETIVNVFCAAMTLQSVDTERAAGDRDVQTAGFGILRERLSDARGAHRWKNVWLPLAGMKIDYRVDLDEAVLENVVVDLQGTIFADGATLSVVGWASGTGGILLDRAVFEAGSTLVTLSRRASGMRVADFTLEPGANHIVIRPEHSPTAPAPAHPPEPKPTPEQEPAR